MPWAPAAPPVPAIETVALSGEAKQAAAQGFRDLVAEALVNPDVFQHLAQFIWQGQLSASFGVSPGGTDFGRASSGWLRRRRSA